MKRFSAEGLSPLEIWDTPVRGKPLYRWSAQREYPQALAEVVREVVAHQRIEQLFLFGGRVAFEPKIVEAIKQLGVETHVSKDPLFEPASSVSAILKHPEALGVDIGQTSTKIVMGTRRFRLERDLHRVPFRDDVTQSCPDEVRAETLRYFVDTLRTVSDLHLAPAAMLAFPCVVDSRCALHGSTYWWSSADALFARQLIEAVGIAAANTYVLNDAELAGATVLLDSRARGRRSLALTIGHGVGGAIVKAV